MKVANNFDEALEMLHAAIYQGDVPVALRHLETGVFAIPFLDEDDDVWHWGIVRASKKTEGKTVLLPFKEGAKGVISERADRDKWMLVTLADGDIKEILDADENEAAHLRGIVPIEAMEDFNSMPESPYALVPRPVLQPATETVVSEEEEIEASETAPGPLQESDEDE
tara:strand:- start:7503 stop:8006 length:504 start_codon:yes stop_codon:yes gene_type:complete